MVEAAGVTLFGAGTVEFDSKQIASWQLSDTPHGR